MEEACFVFRRVLLACSDSLTNGLSTENNRDMTHTLSTLWSYVVTAMDMALTKQQNRIEELEN